MKRRYILSIFGGITILIFAMLIIRSSFKEGIYSLKIKNVLGEDKNIYYTREFRVEGKVLEGSIRQGKSPFNYLWIIRDKENYELQCDYTGSLPDPFGEGREVILSGKLKNKDVMDVKKVVVKCPSKYQEAGKSIEDYEKYYNEKYKKKHNIEGK